MEGRLRVGKTGSRTRKTGSRRSGWTGNADGPLPLHRGTELWSRSRILATLRITRPRPPGPRERMEGGRWRLDRAGRSWAGNASLLPRVLSGDRPRGPPAPPRRIFRRPGLRGPRAAGAVAPGASAVGACVVPASVHLEPDTRHGPRGRPPQPPGSPAGAGARPGADRKSCGHSRAGLRSAGSGPGVPDPGVWGSVRPDSHPLLTPPSLRGSRSRPFSRGTSGGKRLDLGTVLKEADEPESRRDPVRRCSALPGPGGVGQELAPGPGSLESPGGGGDNGAHSRGSGSSAPAASQGAPAPARRRSCSADALRRARAPASHFRGPAGGRGLHGMRARTGRAGAPSGALGGSQLARGAPTWHFSVWRWGWERGHLANAGPLPGSRMDHIRAPCNRGRRRGAGRRVL